MSTKDTLKLCDEIILRCESNTDSVKLCEYIVRTIERRKARKSH